MNKGSHKVDFERIETWEDLRVVKGELREEIDALGSSISSSAREVMIKGAKVTAATVASIVVAKGIAAYSQMQREKAERREQVTSGDGAVDASYSEPTEQPETEANSRLATLFMYVDIVVKLIRSAQIVYGNIQDLRSEFKTEEEE